MEEQQQLQKNFEILQYEHDQHENQIVEADQLLARTDHTIQQSEIKILENNKHVEQLQAELASLDRELVFVENQNEGNMSDRKLIQEQENVVLQMNGESLRRLNELKIQLDKVE